MTKTALAEMLGTSKQNINSLLKNPTRTKIEEIANALDVPIWQLFVSPSEVCSSTPQPNDFLAVVRSNGTTYSANTLAELKSIVNSLDSE